jgi:hypothetical protein
MANKKTLLVIGIDPYLIDFTSPEFAAFPGMTVEKVNEGIQISLTRLAELGYEAELCWTDFGKTAQQVVQGKLEKTQYEGILIGAGIRVPPSNFLLFEQLINTIYEYGNKAKICFNTNPKDTIESVQRWL